MTTDDWLRYLETGDLPATILSTPDPQHIPTATEEIPHR